MTAGVKELTVRATGGPAGPVPTQPARDLIAFLDALARLDYSRDLLLDAAGLSAKDLEDPDARLPCTAWGVVVDAAQRRRPVSNLGLEAAAATPMGAHPLLDYLVLSSDSVGQGYRQLARYIRLVSPCPLEIQEEESPVRIVMTGAPPPFIAEYSLALGVLHFRQETKGRFRPESISFAHRPDDVEAFRRRLGCPVHAEAGWNGVSVSPGAWVLPLPRRDSILRGILERQADDSALSRTEPGVVAEVRRLLLSRMTGGDTNVQGVARHLATTPRTLQRRLAAEGTSYQDLVERTRREAAEGYLADSSLSVGERSRTCWAIRNRPPSTGHSGGGTE